MVMRVLLVVLMIALLPMRGWAITAMAADHAEAWVATQNIATYTYQTRATSGLGAKLSVEQADCHEHTESAPIAQPDAADVATSDHSCTSCDACSLCHLSAAVGTRFTPTNFGHPSTQPLALGQSFASVTSPPRLKPPIG
jgi:hypothetical protein